MISIFKRLTKDRAYFFMLFIFFTLFSYLSVYFSLVYDKPDYFPEFTPYLYIPFFFIAGFSSFLTPQILFAYFFKDKEPLMVFLFGLLIYIAVFTTLGIYIDSFWIKSHYLLAYYAFSFIVAYSIFISIRSIFSEE